MPRGETGELLSRGYIVMLGYWGNEEATRAASETGVVAGASTQQEGAIDSLNGAATELSATAQTLASAVAAVRAGR